MSDIEIILTGAKLLQSAIEKVGMGRPSISKLEVPNQNDFIGLYDVLIGSVELRSSTRELFKDGHFARAVEEAYKCLNNKVKDKSQIAKDGQDLMNQAFSEKNPVLKLNALKTTSNVNEQVGYMLILSGCMRGIRNPRAHEHKKTDTPETALDLLVMADHLMSIVDKAKRVKCKQAPNNNPNP